MSFIKEKGKVEIYGDTDFYPVMAYYLKEKEIGKLRISCQFKANQSKDAIEEG